jgi:hypothetical protein
MTTTEQSHPQLRAFDAAISTLREELRTQTDKAKAAGQEKLRELRSQREAKRLEIMRDIGAEIVKSQLQLAELTAMVASTAGEAKGKGSAKLEDVEQRLAKAKRDMQTYAGSLTTAADADLAMLDDEALAAEPVAKARITRYKERLVSQRDAFTQNLDAFAKATDDKVDSARKKFDVSMQELVALRNEGAAGIN